ncbi:LCP family protein [Streptomyces benahoarensis]|uniref:LytR family transcriptional regulator n=1 Tax=Streptomyces benahoarensis TaxID=2595054 RepID=A0A553YW51_9ACTN|nr:LCP family protein [Streptomyces benahoarensis]TSB17909.1 LytR family transcriptional regulator [Streptomyces benahoarensis]TSB33440.1 LytR family transcriptional regulator [Streptomyces benahoarensis]
MEQLGQEPPPPSATTYRAGRRGRRGADRAAGTGRRPRRWLRRILPALLVVVVLLVAGAAALYLWAGGQVRHVPAIGTYPGRPAAGAGTNWLLVGSDSRAGLTAQQRKELHVGNDGGRNTDTVMVLHTGVHGPSLVSLPRDSYVPVPGHGRRKINEAYADGGPQLLTRTVEQATGLRIERYAEVNFLGLVQVVDALGGVRICPEKPLKDARSGADFRAGCQHVDGRQGLAYARARYSDPQGDLGRVKRQRQLMAAVADRMLGTGMLLHPSRPVPVARTTLAAIRVDDGAGMRQLWDLGWSMRKITGGAGRAVTVPVARPGVSVSGAGDVLLWDTPRARLLFQALRRDDPIPTSVTN